ncbi:hypothetical protein NL676_005578 [Syzygium grande]|nr:hypothetical protein NL676_005578 [Syzygium grande]
MLVTLSLPRSIQCFGEGGERDAGGRFDATRAGAASPPTPVGSDLGSLYDSPDGDRHCPTATAPLCQIGNTRPATPPCLALPSCSLGRSHRTLKPEIFRSPRTPSAYVMPGFVLEICCRRARICPLSGFARCLQPVPCRDFADPRTSSLPSGLGERRSIAILQW